MSVLFDSLSSALIALDSLSPHRVNNGEIDQDSVNVKATEAERAFTVALDRLGELVNVAVANNMGPDADCLAGLLQFALKAGVIVDDLRKFHVGAGEIEGKIGDKAGEVSIIDLSSQLYQHFRLVHNSAENSQRGSGVSDVGHNKFSVAVELFRQADRLERSVLRAEPWPEDEPWTPLHIRNLASCVLMRQ